MPGQTVKPSQPSQPSQTVKAKQAAVKPAAASETLTRILDAATSEFSEHGYAGARMEIIARRAGVNKAALYYHVGDKSALYRKVLEDVFSVLASDIHMALESAHGPEERLRVFITNLAGIVLGRKQFSLIVLREIASGFNNFPPDIVTRIDAMLTIYLDIVKEGKLAGVFREDFNPVVGHAMIIGSLHILNASGQIADRLSGSQFSYSLNNLRPSEEEISGEICRNVLAAIRTEAAS